MKVVFLSNSFNHYQKALSDELYRVLGSDYVFMESVEQSQDRIRLGWKELDAPYKKSLYKIGDEAALSLINEADAVVYGTNFPLRLIRQRERKGKLILVCTERLLKKGDGFSVFFPRLLKYNYFFPYRKNVYLLCMGAYVYRDYRRMGLFKGRGFQYGYFPAKKTLEIDALLAAKKPNSLVWVGRMIDWKHPELAIDTAEQLRAGNVPFHLKMIGTGELLDSMAKLVQEKHLENDVEVLGPRSPEEVRQYMEEAEVFLFTSDRNEGWGVVLNEAMNSGCVPIADRSIGAAPYLISDRENGLVYEREEEIPELIKYLFKEKDKRAAIAENAYKTITDLWNPCVAAERLVALINCIQSDGDYKNLYPDGPCKYIE